MVPTVTEEQKLQLQSITVSNGINTWDYILELPEDSQYWVAAGILSLQKKGRPINRLTIFWEIEDLRNPPKKDESESRRYPPSKEVMEKLTEEQKQQIQGLTLHDDMNAWDYVLSAKDSDQYWAAVGILSCVEHGYNLNSLTINWEARELRYKNQTADMRWDSHLQGVYQFAFNYSTGVHPVNYRRLKEIFDEAFTWHEGQVECGYLPSFGGKPYSIENRQALAQEVYEKLSKEKHRLTDLVERLKIAMDCLGRNADSIENILDMRKIIFLEFHGVMISDRYQTQLQASGSPLRDDYGAKFDPVCVENLRHIIDTTDADIVIMSTWKVGLRLKGIQQMWNDRQLPGKIIGITPNTDPAKRGNEIAVWLDAQTEAVRYVIIDDIAFLFREDQLSHLFKVDKQTGLDEETAKKVVEYLNLNITEEQKLQIQQATLKSGLNAWDYVLQQSEADRPWVIAGILSCMKKGYGLTKLEINWETRNLRYAKSQND